MAERSRTDAPDPAGGSGDLERSLAAMRAHRARQRVKAVLTHLGLVAFCVVCLYPLLRILAVSLRPGDRIISTDLALIPAGASFASYLRVFNDTNFLLWLWNSLVITGTTSLIGVCLASTAGYAFSRFKFPGSKVGLTLLLGTQMIPAAMLLLPLFLMIMKLGLANTYLGIVIAYSVSSLPFSIWILKGYYDTIPRSLEEAALVDGTSRFGAFYRIVLPLSTPALSIAFLFNFTQAWNEYLVARVVLTDSHKYTWTLGLFELQGQYLTQWGMFAAASLMVTVPVLMVFLYSSKWLISGLTLGGVKG
ncbi:MAG: carbohydrate ABC transporter permease [Elusimicrobiota bacterium]